MAGSAAILASNPGEIVSPAVPQTDYAVAPNYERFDGLAARNGAGGPRRSNPPGAPNGMGAPPMGEPSGPAIVPGELDHPAALDPLAGGSGGGGAAYGWGHLGGSPRPGGSDQPLGQVYTEGPLQGVVGTLGGQPLAVVVGDRIHRPTGDYTHSKWPTIQGRLGVGQYGPSELGVAQTVALSEITNAPPVPGDLTAILAGLG